MTDTPTLPIPTSRPTTPRQGGGHRLYGVDDVAGAVGVAPRLVAAWCSLGSHGIPAPDGRLAGGDVWLAATIEPWLSRHALLRRRAAGRDLVARRAAREVAGAVLTLGALLVEGPPYRPRAVTAALAELEQAVARVAGPRGVPAGDLPRAGRDAVAAILTCGRGLVRALPADIAEAPDVAPLPPRAGARIGRLRRAVLDGLPAIADLARLGDGEGDDVGA